jgi:hypothetical protein
MCDVPYGLLISGGVDRCHRRQVQPRASRGGLPDAFLVATDAQFRRGTQGCA